MATVDLDLDALRRDLEAVGVSCAQYGFNGLRIGDSLIVFREGNVRAFDFGNQVQLKPNAFQSLAIIARHLGHCPAPLTDGEMRRCVRAGIAEVKRTGRVASGICYAVIDALPERFGVRREGAS